MTLTADEIIKRFNMLPRTTFPATGQPIVINDDKWAGEVVVKVSDVTHLLGWLCRRVDER